MKARENTKLLASLAPTIVTTAHAGHEHAPASGGQLAGREQVGQQRRGGARVKALAGLQAGIPNLPVVAGGCDCLPCLRRTCCCCWLLQCRGRSFQAAFVFKKSCVERGRTVSHRWLYSCMSTACPGSARKLRAAGTSPGADMLPLPLSLSLLPLPLSPLLPLLRSVANVHCAGAPSAAAARWGCSRSREARTGCTEASERHASMPAQLEPQGASPSARSI